MKYTSQRINSIHDKDGNIYSICIYYDDDGVLHKYSILTKPAMPPKRRIGVIVDKLQYLTEEMKEVISREN